MSDHTKRPLTEGQKEILAGIPVLPTLDECAPFAVLALKQRLAKLEKCLNDIWGADEMGYIVDIGYKECGTCGAKALKGELVKHEDYCVQGWIEKALAK